MELPKVSDFGCLLFWFYWFKKFYHYENKKERRYCLAKLWLYNTVLFASKCIWFEVPQVAMLVLLILEILHYTNKEKTPIMSGKSVTIHNVITVLFQVSTFGLKFRKLINGDVGYVGFTDLSNFIVWEQKQKKRKWYCLAKLELCNTVLFAEKFLKVDALRCLLCWFWSCKKFYASEQKQQQNKTQQKRSSG